MTIEVFDFAQGSVEWFDVRKGIPTASMFSDVIAQKGPKGGIPRGRQKYLYRLAGEIISGTPEATYSNAHMDRGTANEDEARNLYALLESVEPERVGFVRNGLCGCSPDSLIGDRGMLEIKDAIGSVQIERLLDNCLPSEHKAQVQGGLMVCERDWCDFMSHSRGLPPLIVRVYRDETYIAELRKGIELFVGELHALVARIKAL